MIRLRAIFHISEDSDDLSRWVLKLLAMKASAIGIDYDPEEP